MRTKLFNRFSFLVLSLLLMVTSMASAQVLINAPQPADNPNLPGNSPWSAICAGANGGFNQYYTTVSWVGTPNLDNEWILELSNASGSFASPIELARETSNAIVQNPGFEFSIPSNTRGAGYKIRVRSTSPAKTSSESASYSMYYMDIVTNLHISPNGDGTSGDVCSTGPVTMEVDNVANPASYQYIWQRNGSVLASTGPSVLADQNGVYQAFIDYGTICTGSGNTDSNFTMVTIGGSGMGIAINPPSKTALCAGDMEVLSISLTDPSWSYQWFKNNTAIAGATAATYAVDANTAGFEGGYQVEISATGICNERSATVNITNADSFTVTRDNAATVVVLPSLPQTLSVTTTASSPNFQWYRNGSPIGTDSSNLAVTQEGTYYVEVTQNGGTCPGTKKNSENTIVSVPNSFEVIIDYASAYTACVSTSLILQVSTINAVALDGSKTDVTTTLADSFTYQWKKNSVNITGETAKNISLTSTSENGSYTLEATLSTYSDTSNALTVQLLTNETLTINSTGTVYCNGTETISVTTTTDLTGESFSWERDGTSVDTSNVALEVSAPGIYRLVINKNGCDLRSNEITISSFDESLIQLDVDGDIVFPEGSSKTVTARGGTSYEWFDANNNLMSSSDSMTFTQDGEYILVSNIDNCQVTKQLTAVYLDLFNIPNVITPNGDGANDQWIIPNSYSNKSDVNVIIYNDRGAEVLNVMGYQNNWPSSSISFQSQNMVFYYVVKNATTTLKKGTITVIR
ncbi:MAG: gliding motility-associated C-terminal domain-containing protein [Flavobacteriales bacterium]|nr:MAG: gliding motility-associated C-terminal domain-containing protein [Flavobacteriales bacterium]